MLLFYTLFQNPIIPLSDSLLLDYLGEKKNYYGRFRLWGSIGYMFSVSLLGYFLEVTSSVNLFYVYAFILILSIILLKFLPKSRREIEVLNPGDFKKIFKKKRLLYFLFLDHNDLVRYTWLSNNHQHNPERHNKLFHDLTH